MGINYVDVREVFHFCVPEDTESYIQETGHAGRDGRPSLAVLVPTSLATRITDKSINQVQKYTAEIFYLVIWKITYMKTMENVCVVIYI